MSDLRRVFVDLPAPYPVSFGTEIDLPSGDAHHLRNVLRLEEGANVTAICRASATEYEALIADARDGIRLKILSPARSHEVKGVARTLIFALAKGKKNDLVCEKACELGIESVVLWQADRSVLRIKSDRDRVSKLSRFQRVMEAAAKQCRRSSIPHVDLALNFPALFACLNRLREPKDALLCCSLSPEAISLRNAMPQNGRAHILVGPEGDLTRGEENSLVEFGFKLVNLGPATLRCETAAIAAVALAQLGWSTTEEKHNP